MNAICGRVASFVVIAALTLIAATTVAAANPDATYTCVKEKRNGDQDVRVGVPASAVSGLTNAGFTCVATTEETSEEEQGEQGEQGAAIGPAVEPYVAPESRSLYCSTNGPAYRANNEGMGIALNLTDTQGDLMVELGLVRPANFYEGVGASCDLLPGFKDSGTWVDNVGDVVPGVAVYPLFVAA